MREAVFFMFGMILLAVVAALIFFGITDRFFGKMGVANWVAFLLVLAFAVAAMFPPLVLASGVSFSYAGFFLPLLLGVVAMFSLGATSSLLRAVVGCLAVAGIVLAARVAMVPVASYRAAVPAFITAGLAGGVAAFVIARGRLAVLASLLTGCVLGDFIAAMLFRFVTGATYMLQLGQNGLFDTVVLAAVAGGLTCEIAQLVHRAVSRRAGVSMPAQAPVAVGFEAGQDNALNKTELPAHSEDDDLFDDYFNVDID